MPVAPCVVFGTDRADSRVVDQHVQSTKARLDAREEFRHLSAGGNVAYLGDAFVRPRGGHFLTGGVQVLLVDVAYDDLAAGTRISQCNALSETSRTARHEGDLVIQCHTTAPFRLRQTKAGLKGKVIRPMCHKTTGSVALKAPPSSGGPGFQEFRHARADR